MRSKRDRGGGLHHLGDDGKAVWVDLRALFPPPPEGGATIPAGLILDEIEPGVLKRWIRSSRGDWVGVVTIVLGYAKGGTYPAYDQLIPAQALRPR